MKIHQLMIAGLLIAAGSYTLLSGEVNPEKEKQTDLKNTSKKDVLIEKPADAKIRLQQSDPLLREIQTSKSANKKDPAKCVFMTAFDGEGLNQPVHHPIPAKVMSSIDEGLSWLADAQHNDGGWGAGSRNRQDIRDPHAVKSDPATTAMVAMSLARSGSTIKSGEYSGELKNALNYLIDAVESSDENSLNITTQTGTQPQSKLGQNIDVVLTSQFLSNIIHDLDHDPQLKRRVRRSIQKCVDKIEMGQTANGSLQGSGWAGVLQSSFATSALESAVSAGAEVDELILDKSRNYQKSNINTKNNSVVTESAAGIVLYSVSGSARATAKETAEAKEKIREAKRAGKVESEEVTIDNLTKAGMAPSQAMKYATAYQINQQATKLAQDENVMSGFGNNGGEEFLSYLQTGEGMIMSNDQGWKNWYDKMSRRLISIQNNDGSWSGHHCITSPVFCTATCLLILSVNNDVGKLTLPARIQN